MRGQILLAAAGAAALALSIPVVLVGRAVLATPDEVARVNTGWPSGSNVRKQHRDLVDRAAAGLLDTGRAERFAEVVRIYRNATALPVVAGQPTGPIRIAHLVPKLHTDEERAQALVMASTLLAMAAGDGLGVPEIGRDPGSKALLRQSVGGFQTAVQLDDRNEAAKFDLELLLRQAGAGPPAAPPRKKTTASGKPKASPKKKQQKRQEGHSEVSHASVYATGSGY